jgi:futalosine hydrolase
MENKGFKTMFDLGLMKKDEFPFRKGWLVNPALEYIKDRALPEVTAITVNQVTVSKQMIRLYQSAFDPGIESQEGAALHYVCLMEGIPFLQIRSISNLIGERNKEKWKMKESIAALNREIVRVTETLCLKT